MNIELFPEASKEAEVIAVIEHQSEIDENGSEETT
jgi:hypothetical protein